MTIRADGKVARAVPYIKAYRKLTRCVFSQTNIFTFHFSLRRERYNNMRVASCAYVTHSAAMTKVQNTLVRYKKYIKVRDAGVFPLSVAATWVAT